MATQRMPLFGDLNDVTWSITQSDAALNVGGGDVDNVYEMMSGGVSMSRVGNRASGGDSGQYGMYNDGERLRFRPNGNSYYNRRGSPGSPGSPGSLGSLGFLGAAGTVESLGSPRSPGSHVSSGSAESAGNSGRRLRYTTEVEMEIEWDVSMDTPNEILRYLLRMGFATLMHPYEYAKVLMQLGYEPLPLIASKSWLGKPTLFLPSVYRYIRYIKRTDGLIGLYRGLAPRILSSTFSALFSNKLVEMLGISEYSQQKQKQQPHPFKEYAWNMLRDSIVVTTGLAISHPFYVISVRQMAQFVGREVVYANVGTSFTEIFKQDGILGFYAGFVPRLLCDLGVLFITSSLSTICNRVFLSKPNQQKYNSAIIQFGAIMLLYPLQVAGACMACSGSGLAAGAPPYMPIYSQWLDCLMDLFARGDHYRGALVFRRTLPRMQMQRIHDPFNIYRMS